MEKQTQRQQQCSDKIKDNSMQESHSSPIGLVTAYYQSFIVDKKKVTFTGKQKDKYLTIYNIRSSKLEDKDNNLKTFPSTAQGVLTILNLQGDHAKSVITDETVSAGIQLAYETSLEKRYNILDEIRNTGHKSVFEGFVEGEQTQKRLSQTGSPLTPRNRAIRSGLGGLVANLLGNRDVPPDVHVIGKDKLTLIPFGVETQNSPPTIRKSDLLFTPRTEVDPPGIRKVSDATYEIFFQHQNKTKLI